MKQKIFDENSAKIRELFSYSYADGLDQIIARINCRTVNLDTRHILIVPDKYTLDAETRLFADNSGAFDVEVLTFSRLFYRLSDADTPYLAREAAIMLIRGICQNIDLACYKKSAKFGGFGERVYETINKLLDSGVDIENASAASKATAVRLEDIKKIYSRYKELTRDKFIDRNGRLELLCAQIKNSETVKNSHFYIANFMDFTSGEQKVISELDKYCLSLTVSVTDKQPPPIGAKSVEVYDCIGSIDALKAAARRIRTAVIGGMRYKDICIVMSSPSFDEAERVFLEYQIPFYTDYSLCLAEHSLAVFVETVMDVIERQYRRSDMIELAKNIYSHADKSDSDIFENFVNEYNVDYLAFKEEFSAQKYLYGGGFDKKNGENFLEFKERLAGSERVRKKIMRMISALEPLFKKIDSAAGFCDFIGEILKFSGCFALSSDKKQRAEEFGFCHDESTDFLTSQKKSTETAREKIEEILALMQEVLGEEKHRCGFLREVFGEGLSACKIMAIPDLSDSVSIAVPSTFRGQRFKYVFVLGMNEGEVPAPKPNDGLIGGDGQEIEGFCLPKENENIVELDHILAAAEDKIFISYDSASESGMANYLKAFISKNSGKIWKNSLIAEDLTLAFLEDSGANLERLVLSYAVCKAGATELFLSGVSGYKKLGHIPKYQSAVYAALKSYGVDKYLSGEKNKETICCKDSVFLTENISVSRLQEYFSCPYSHFVKYVLRAKTVKSGELLAVDIGTILHAVAELFVKERKSWDKPNLAAEILGNILDSQPNVRQKIKPDMLARLQKEAAELCEILMRQFRLGSFEPLGQEISLKNSALIKPLAIAAGGKSLVLDGSVDFADASGGLVRIIDYKTGKTELGYSDIFYGKKIQLPLYMQAFIKSGYRAAGFFLFPLSKKWTDDEYSHRLKGVFDRDINTLVKMDGSLQSGGTSSVIRAKTAANSKGEVKLYGRHDYALESSQISAICDYAQSIAAGAIAEILSGYIAARPYKKGKTCACDYCDYTSICGQQYKTPREVTSVKAAALLGGHLVNTN